MTKTKVVGHIPLDLKERYSDATYRICGQSMSLNLKLCDVRAKEYNMNFIEYVARCINHEQLHHIFQVEHGNEVSRGLDNIAKANKDYWMW